MHILYIKKLSGKLASLVQSIHRDVNRPGVRSGVHTVQTGAIIFSAVDVFVVYPCVLQWRYIQCFSCATLL